MAGGGFLQLKAQELSITAAISLREISSFFAVSVRYCGTERRFDMSIELCKYICVILNGIYVLPVTALLSSEWWGRSLDSEVVPHWAINLWCITVEVADICDLLGTEGAPFQGRWSAGLDADDSSSRLGAGRSILVFLNSRAQCAIIQYVSFTSPLEFRLLGTSMYGAVPIIILTLVYTETFSEQQKSLTQDDRYWIKILRG